MQPPISRRIFQWVNERWPLERLMGWGLHEEIPGGTRFSYTLGSACLFLLIIQTVTGVWQMFFYVPTVDYAYSSLNYLRLEVPFGWLIHGLHYWGAHAFTVVVGLHVIRVFIWGAYKKPRELVWLSGVVLLILTAVFMFTGPVLPWDKKGYWAAEVGLNMAGSVPAIGPWLQSMLQGASKLGQVSLTRFYVIHVALLPFAAITLVVIHLVAFRVYGSVGPWKKDKQDAAGEFWPEQLFKDALVWFFIFMLLVGLSAFVPAPIAGLADPLDALYTPKPEWNFFFLYQCLKLFSGPLEPLGTVGIPTLIIVTLFSLPFIDRSPERDPLKRVFVMLCGFLFVSFVLGMTLWGYYGNPPQDKQAKIRLNKMKETDVALSHRGIAQEKAGVRPVGAVPQSPGEKYVPGDILFQTMGCAPCHGVEGKPSNKQGPDLKMVLNRGVSREWLWAQLIAPEKHNPDTVMPLFGHLSDQRLNALIDYLQGLVADKQPMSHMEAAAAGKELFHSLGCLQCHTATGTPGHTKGPDLAVALEQENKVSKEWLYGQLVNPQKHNLTTIMPSYGHLADHQLDALVAFLEDLSRQKKGALPRDKAGPGTSPAQTQVSSTDNNGPGEAVRIVGNRDHGMVLYQQYCMRCHGPEGTINPSDVSVLPGVPSIRPISRKLFNEDLMVFLRSIDPQIQHGVRNKKGGPDMPAFGDTHEMTQAQIADTEAYVLHLNEIERDRIINPGMEPRRFFYLLVMFSILGAIIFGVLFGERVWH